MNLAAALLAGYMLASSNSNPARPPKPFERDDVAPPGQALAMLAAQRGTFRPITLAPRAGVLLGPAATLAWFSPASGMTYDITLRGLDQAEVWRTSTSADRVTVPATAAFEQGKTYFWAVTASSALGKRSVSAPVFIRVLAGGERAEIEAALAAAGSGDDPETASRRLDVLEHEGLWYDAIAMLDGLVTRFPQNPEPHERLGKIYSALTWTSFAADREFVLADKLRYGWLAPIVKPRTRGTLRTAAGGSGGATQAKAAKPEPAPPKNAVRTPVKSDLSGFDLVDPNQPDLQSTVVAATRGLPALVPLAPRLGLAYGLAPEFGWSDPQPAGRYRFVLLDDDGSQVYQTDVAGTRLAYPPDAPVLEPGRTYWWYVRTASPGPARRTWSAGFRLVDGALRESLTATRGADRLVAYLDGLVWYDALEALNAQLALQPGNVGALEARAALYGQFDWTRPLGEADVARAAKLRR